jgi:quinol monooxygenase YgiN
MGFGLIDPARPQSSTPQAPDGSPGSLDLKSDMARERRRAPMKHSFVENVVMIAELNVKPGKLAEFLDYTVANLKLSRGYSGNLAFDSRLNEADPTKVTFYEVWTSLTAQQEYMAWRVGQGDLTKLMSYLVGEPKFTALRSLAG